VPNSMLKARLSKWIAFSRTLADVIGSVIPEDSTEVPVSPWYSLHTCRSTQTVLDIVHAVSYSLLLLNTDLHVAELTTRMSRNQFVRNTLTAIQMQLQPTSPAQISTSDLTHDDGSNIARKTTSDGIETVSRTKRSDSITSWNSVSREAIMSSPVVSGQTPSPGRHSNGSTPSVQIPSGQDHKPPNSTAVYDRAWENDMESLLKVCAFTLQLDSLRNIRVKGNV
jgi:Sec7 domain